MSRKHRLICRISPSIFVESIPKNAYNFVNTAILNCHAGIIIDFKIVSLHNFLSLFLRRMSNEEYIKT